MNNLEVIKTLVMMIEPKTELDGDLKKAAIALLEKEAPVKQAKPKAKPKTTGRKKLELDWGKAKACRDAGWSYAKIADELGCSEQTVYNHFKQEVQQ